MAFAATTPPGGVTCAAADTRTGECAVEIPLPPSEPSTLPGATTGAVPATTEECLHGGDEVPCQDGARGSWSNSRQCYLRLALPQPPASAPVWGGRFPDGAVYECDHAVPGEVTPYVNVTTVWIDGPPDLPTLTPGAAASVVVRRLPLRAVRVGIVPEPGPDRLGLVGLPVWMWADQPDPLTFGPTAVTESAGGRSVSVTARVERVEWSMGDGTTVVCRTPGTVYEPRFGDSPSPDCGHRYGRSSAGQPGDAYEVRARSFWTAAWTSGGVSGVIPVELETSVLLRVGESQVLVTD